MNGKRCHISLALAIAILMMAGLLILMWLLGGPLPQAAYAQGTIRYVAPGGNCGTASPCYSTVQEAVDTAQAGDEIRIAAGTYTDIHTCILTTVMGDRVITQVLHLDKSLTIQGGYTTADWMAPDPDANLTILDAQERARVLYVKENNSTIEGLRLTGGDAEGLVCGRIYAPYENIGGGACIDGGAPVLRNNQVYSNTAFNGGGLYLYSSEATLSSNRIYGNTATGGGGGLSLHTSDATLTYNHIYNNTGVGGGGGISLSGDAVLIGNYIYSNTVPGTMFSGVGGGLFLHGDAVLIGNIITGNSTLIEGGGMFIASNNVTLNSNVISGNDARTGSGGGIVIECISGYSVNLINNVVVGNTAHGDGPGVSVQGGNATHYFRHNTIASNTGGDGSGVCVGETGNESITIWLTNTIIVSQTVGICAVSGNTATLNSVLWYNNTGGNTGGPGVIYATNEITGNPAFAPDGYHLTAGSAAIDNGIDAGVSTDIDNEPRPYQDCDLGADEYWPPGALKRIYLPLVLRNYQ
jgi:hypothetical protein